MTGVHPIQLGTRIDLSTEDILRLLRDYDFQPAIEQEERIQRSSQALDEAYKLLAARHPILPAPNFTVPSGNIFNPLRERTGAEDMQGILELGLSADDIVRLLEGYDFEDDARRAEQRSRNRQAIRAACKQLEIPHPRREGCKRTWPVYSTLREATGAQSNAAVDDLGLSTEDIVRLLQNCDLDSKS